MAIEFVDVLDAANNTYDPTNSTLTDTRVQDAIDSLDAKIGGPVSLAMVNLTVTDSDVSASSGTHYNLTVSGMTAERNVILPEASIGDVIRLNLVSDAPAEYELVIKGDATVTINGGNVATEWSRLFINDEVVEFIATSNTNWDVIHDGRINPPITVTLSATQTFSSSTMTRAGYDTTVEDKGNLFDTTNARFQPRRTGTYVALSSPIFMLITSGSSLISRIYKNAGFSTLESQLTNQAAPSSASVLTPGTGSIVVTDISDYYEFSVFSSDATPELSSDSKLLIIFGGY